MVKVGVCRVTACYNEKKKRGEVISRKRTFGNFATIWGCLNNGEIMVELVSFGRGILYYLLYKISLDLLITSMIFCDERKC